LRFGKYRLRRALNDELRAKKEAPEFVVASDRQLEFLMILAEQLARQTEERNADYLR
jgi:hypothetical protein